MRDGTTEQERTGTATGPGPRRTRRGQRGWAVGAAVLLVGGLLGGCTSSANDAGATDPKATSEAARPEDRLYVIEATAGTAKADGSTVDLALDIDDERVVWFQDRPGRDHGEVAVADLVADWEDLGFASDPPNVVVAPDDARTRIALEMTDPTYDADAHVLRFTGTLPTGTKASLPEHLEGASVLIDGVAAPARASSSGSASREFAQRAGSVSIDPLDGGRFTLTLADTAPRTTWISDRPHRGAGALANRTFVDRWSIEGFVQDPPNAELVVGSGDDAQRVAVELSDPTYRDDNGEISYQAVALAPDGTSPLEGTDVPELADPDQPSTLYIDSAATVEAQFGQECGQRQVWKPAHLAGGTYVIEAWGAKGGTGGAGGGAGGAGGYTVSRVDATLVDIVAGGQPISVAVGCVGSDGDTKGPENGAALTRGGGGGGGASSWVRVADQDHTSQAGCVPGRVWIVDSSTSCTVLAVAGGGGGGGGQTQGHTTSDGGAGADRGPRGADGGEISGDFLTPAGGGGGGGSETAPVGGKCGSWNEGGNPASCKGKTADGREFTSIGWAGGSGAGGAGGDAAYQGTQPPDDTAGGDGGIVPQVIDHDGTGGAGPDGNSYAGGELDHLSGSGPGGGGGGWGGGGGGSVSFYVTSGSQASSGSGGGGGGSFSYSEGVGWAAGGASPGGSNGWVRISWIPGGMLPTLITADGTVNANVQSGWVNGSATTQDAMRWVGRGKVGAAGIVGAAATGGDLVAIATEGGGLRAHTSSDGGATWKAAGALPSGIAWQAMDATDDVVVVASPDGKVAYSSDAGATWKTADTGLSKLTAIDRVPGVAGGFAAVGGSQVALGSFASGSLTWQVDTAASPGKDLVAVAGVGPAVVVADQAAGTASTKAATVGGTWHTTPAPLPHHGKLVGAAGTGGAVVVPGHDGPDGVGSVVVIDATNPTVNVSSDVQTTGPGTWPTKNIGPIHEEGSSSSNLPQLVEQCRDTFYIANLAASTTEAQVWTSADIQSQAATGVGWITGLPGTVPANVVAIAC